MEKKMRRFKQQLSESDTIELLRGTTSGVLALCGADMQPYGVPLSHVYDNGKLYFHSALDGHKLDLIEENSSVCFTVIAQDEIHPETYTTYYRSAIAFGKISIIDDREEKRRALKLLGQRCNPTDAMGLQKEIANGFHRCKMLVMGIERLTGKQSIELVKR